MKCKTCVKELPQIHDIWVTYQLKDEKLIVYKHVKQMNQLQQHTVLMLIKKNKQQCYQSDWIDYIEIETIN